MSSGIRVLMTGLVALVILVTTIPVYAAGGYDSREALSHHPNGDKCVAARMVQSQAEKQRFRVSLDIQSTLKKCDKYRDYHKPRKGKEFLFRGSIF